ncbi:hypothetical protein FSARC_8507 [Fusarium sarcochroum]|uniref:UBC core domain-containing protein n=1 Tax=Fusarium sarcochroum TaxID=1208366 RepID=A0A8H4X699_9HYPO|nr:hypothetical protein FSARC_8507 [Fusarium sarcochroum]
MEAAGLAIGILGLAGLFKTALEAWEFVDSARDQAESFGFFTTRLDSQRAIFLIWAERMGFNSPEGYNRNLDLPRLRACQIADTLKQMAVLFSNTDQLVQKYGLKIQSTQTQVLGDETIDGLLPERNCVSTAIFRSRYDGVTAIVRRKRNLIMPPETIQLQQRESLWKKTRWSIRDEKKTECLLGKIRALIDDLEGLTRDVQAYKSKEQCAAEAVANISEAALHEIENSSRALEDVISSAASIRLGSLHRAQTLATTSISSVSFVTAGSRPSSQREPESCSPRDSEHRSDADARVIEFSRIMAANHQACADIVAKTSPEWFSDCHKTIDRYFYSRVYRELKQFAKETRPNNWYTITPIDESNLDKFLGTFRGPAGTPYEGGIFHVRINLSKGYPFSPPQVWFLTKILHPNIDKNGAICMDTLAENWSPVLEMQPLIASVAMLLDKPFWDDPIEGAMPLDWTPDRGLFDVRAREWTRQYATGRIINPGERDDGFYNVTDMIN